MIVKSKRGFATYKVSPFAAVTGLMSGLTKINRPQAASREWSHCSLLRPVRLFLTLHTLNRQLGNRIRERKTA